MTEHVITPPRLAERILRATAPADEEPYVLSDLCEELQMRAQLHGAAAARRWYWRQVLTSIIPLLRIRLTTRPVSREVRMDTMKNDVAFALRMLTRRPLFAAVSILTLALGIGAATAIFTIVDGVLLRPLPFRAGEQLVTIWQTDTLYRHQATLRERWNRLW